MRIETCMSLPTGHGPSTAGMRCKGSGRGWRGPARQEACIIYIVPSCYLSKRQQGINRGTRDCDPQIPPKKVMVIDG